MTDQGGYTPAPWGGVWSPTRRVVADVQIERAAQDEKWGEQNHPDGTGPHAELLGVDFARWADELRRVCQAAAADGTVTWAHILTEEVAEAFACDDPARLRTELVQVAAVAVAWIEAIDRRALDARLD